MNAPFVRAAPACHRTERTRTKRLKPYTNASPSMSSASASSAVECSDHPRDRLDDEHCRIDPEHPVKNAPLASQQTGNFLAFLFTTMIHRNARSFKAYFKARPYSDYRVNHAVLQCDSENLQTYRGDSASIMRQSAIRPSPRQQALRRCSSFDSRFRSAIFCSTSARCRAVMRSTSAHS